jgi:hypothetical protein
VEGTKSFLRYHGVEISNERVKQKALRNAMQNAMKLRVPSQMTIPVEQVEESLKAGWEFVANLPNGKVIVGK